MISQVDHDAGDEDRSGSVACFCQPWCGLPVCGCGEDHGAVEGRCRDCNIDHLFDSMRCRRCHKLRLNDLGVSFYGPDAKCKCSTEGSR